MNKGTMVIVAITLAVVGFLGFVVSQREVVSSELDGFAQCIAASEAKFYGAFWCPHCIEQKALFGKAAAEKLPYVECSNPDKKSQTQICVEKKITGYPTWELANGERLSGNQTLETLATKTSCVLPE